MTLGPSKVVKLVQERVLEPGEQLIGLVLDNSYAIETGGSAPGGARYSGDTTVQRLVERRGLEPGARVPCGVLALTERRLLCVKWPIREPEVLAEAPVPGPRLTYAESRGALAWRTYLLVELGDGRFTTLSLQPRSFGVTARKTKAGLDALIAGFDDAAEKVELGDLAGSAD
jgi:hypothetical protein